MGAESSAPSAALSEARLASEVDAGPAHDAGVPHGALSVPQPIMIAIGKSAASARNGLRSMSKSMVTTAEHRVYHHGLGMPLQRDLDGSASLAWTMFSKSQMRS